MLRVTREADEKWDSISKHSALGGYIIVFTSLQPKVYRATSCDHVSGDELTVCQGKELPSVPPLEFLVDGHHLDILVLLDGVPWSGVRLGPDDCMNVESEIGERGAYRGTVLEAHHSGHAQGG